MSDNFDSIIKTLPEDYVNKMGLEALRSIYDFNIFATGDNVTTEDMLHWRKYYSVEQCCEDLNLKDCVSWLDVIEYYPVYETMSDGATLVAVCD